MDVRLSEGEDYSLYSISNSNDRILLSHKEAEATSMEIIENKQNGNTWNITESFRVSYEKYIFNPKKHNEVFGLSKTKDLFVIDYEAKSQSAVIAGNVDQVFIINGQLYGLIKENKLENLYRFDQANQKTRLITELPLSDTGYQIGYLNQTESFSVLALSTKKLYLYNPESNNYYPKGVLIQENVDSILPSPGGQYIGFFSGGNLRAYEPEKNRYFDIIIGKKVESVSWLKDQFNLIYREAGKIKLVTVGGFYDKVISNAESILPVVVSPSSARVFFVSKKNSLPLDPKTDLAVFDLE
jgi:hypothetical protein